MRLVAKTERWTCVTASGMKHKWTAGKCYNASFSAAGIAISSDAGRERIGWDEIPAEVYAETFGIDITAKRRVYEEG